MGNINTNVWNNLKQTVSYILSLNTLLYLFVLWSLFHNHIDRCYYLLKLRNQKNLFLAKCIIIMFLIGFTRFWNFNLIIRTNSHNCKEILMTIDFSICSWGKRNIVFEISRNFDGFFELHKHFNTLFTLK